MRYYCLGIVWLCTLLACKKQKLEVVYSTTGYMNNPSKGLCTQVTPNEPTADLELRKIGMTPGACSPVLNVAGQSAELLKACEPVVIDERVTQWFVYNKKVGEGGQFTDIKMDQVADICKNIPLIKKKIE